MANGLIDRGKTFKTFLSSPVELAKQARIALDQAKNNRPKTRKLDGELSLKGIN